MVIGYDHSAERYCCYQGCGTKCDPMAPDQLLKAVKLARWSRHDWLVSQESFDVQGQTVDRFVASGAVLFQALHRYPVQVTSKERDEALEFPGLAAGRGVKVSR